MAFQQFSSQVACNGLKAHLDFKFIESKDKKVNNKNVNEDAHVSSRHIAKITDKQRAESTSRSKGTSNAQPVYIPNNSNNTQNVCTAFVVIIA